MDQPKLLIYSYSFALIDFHLHNLRVDLVLNHDLALPKTRLLNEFYTKTHLDILVLSIEW